jgi:hypothetical protein
MCRDEISRTGTHTPTICALFSHTNNLPYAATLPSSCELTRFTRPLVAVLIRRDRRLDNTPLARQKREKKCREKELQEGLECACLVSRGNREIGGRRRSE